MIDLDANILLPDGSTIKAEKIKTDMQLADLGMKPQTVRRKKVTKEKEFQMLEFENGAKFFCLVYLSFLTKDSELTAQELKTGEKVLGFDGEKFIEVAVKNSFRISSVARRNTDVPKKVKMVFFETFEDMPFIADGICIGMRKQLGLGKVKRPLF